MKKEAYLRCRVSEKLKDKLEAKAELLGMTASDLLRLLATQATQGVSKIARNADETEETQEKNDGRIRFRLNKNEHQKLREQAEQCGMSITNYSALLIRAKLTGASIPTDAELRALEESNYELMAIGRNLNQIAHALNVKIKMNGKIDEADQKTVRENLLRDLFAYVEAQQQKVESLLDAMQRRSQ